MIGAAIIFTVALLASRTGYAETFVNRVCRIISSVRPSSPAVSADETVVKNLQDQISALNLKIGFIKQKAPEEKA